MQINELFQETMAQVVRTTGKERQCFGFLSEAPINILRDENPARNVLKKFISKNFNSEFFLDVVVVGYRNKSTCYGHTIRQIFQ